LDCAPKGIWMTSKISRKPSAKQTYLAWPSRRPIL
jgi:hypothetical protein